MITYRFILILFHILVPFDVLRAGSIFLGNPSRLSAEAGITTKNASNKSNITAPKSERYYFLALSLRILFFLIFSML